MRYGSKVSVLQPEIVREQARPALRIWVRLGWGLAVMRALKIVVHRDVIVMPFDRFGCRDFQPPRHHR
jgi:hypothetical protein